MWRRSVALDTDLWCSILSLERCANSRVKRSRTCAKRPKASIASRRRANRASVSSDSAQNEDRKKHASTSGAKARELEIKAEAEIAARSAQISVELGKDAVWVANLVANSATEGQSASSSVANREADLVVVLVRILGSERIVRNVLRDATSVSKGRSLEAARTEVDSQRIDRSNARTGRNASIRVLLVLERQNQLAAEIAIDFSVRIVELSEALVVQVAVLGRRGPMNAVRNGLAESALTKGSHRGRNSTSSL